MENVLNSFSSTFVALIIMIFVTLIFGILKSVQIKSVSQQIANVATVGVVNVVNIFQSTFNDIRPVIENLGINGSATVRKINNAMLDGVTTVTTVVDAMEEAASSAFTVGVETLVAVLQNVITSIFRLLGLFVQSWSQFMNFFVASVTNQTAFLGMLFKPVEFMLGIIQQIINLF